MNRTFMVISLCLASIGNSTAVQADELTDQINRTRAQYGLSALTHDDNLAAWAAVNNTHQRARGMGHHQVAPAHRQNAAWNYPTVPTVMAGWMSSAGHRAALLAVEITHCGGHFDGLYWTWNAASFAVPDVAPKVVTSTPKTPANTCDNAGCTAPPLSVPSQACGPRRGGFHPFRRLLRRCR